MDSRRRRSSEVITEVHELFSAKGDEFFGEVIDQRRHALQTATMARQHGADDTIVTAALLHDIGHFLADEADGPRRDLAVNDDHHEALGARWIAPRFGPRAAQAVALHVVAKRYRCTIDPRYYSALSPTSIQTLHAQGGLLEPDDAARFEAHPGFESALLLRECDDLAKDPRMVTEDLETFTSVMQHVIENAFSADESPMAVQESSG